MLWNMLLLALREIRRNIMRSSLTILGIVIGVAAVIIMITLGQGTTARVAADIAALGQNLLIIEPGVLQESLGGVISEASPFDENDVEAIKKEISNIIAVAGSASRPMLAVYGSKKKSTAVTGTDSEFFTIKNWLVDHGRVFNEAELRGGKSVCILGTSVYKALFGSQDPIGASIRLGKLSCEVIGVLKAKGQSMAGVDQDDLVVMPLHAYQKRIAGNRDVSVIYVSAASSEVTGEVKGSIESLLRERRRLRQDAENDFEVFDLVEIARTTADSIRVLTIMLGAIAAVSLLVGGIGIMNIMLVSVTERTREIGIRLAIGARGGEVLIQFLVEAILLASFGGFAGIFLGFIGSAIAAYFMEIPFVPNLIVVIIAFTFSGAVGILFGYFPAQKAARLNPIDALRYE